MSVLVHVSWDGDVLSPELFRDLALEMELGFAPTDIVLAKSRRSVPWTDRNTRRAANGWVRVEGSTGRLRLANVSGRSQIIWTGDRIEDARRLIEQLLTVPGFACGYAGDEEDVEWQSEDRLDAYTSLGRSHEGLPKVPVVNGMPGETERIDISHNPGRRKMVAGMWLWAAAHMWFAPPAFRLLDRQRLLDLPVGNVTQRPDGLVEVELFPQEWFTTNLEEVRHRQKTFREWMDLDRLETDPPAGLLDPESVAIAVENLSEGSRRVTTWLDESHTKAVPKAHAKYRLTQEFGPSGLISSKLDEI